MKKAIQDGLLSIYRHARRQGMFSTPLGRWVFLSAYSTYKKLWEPDITFLRRFVPSDCWIIDVGANVGFFSRQFCRWVSGQGRVLAVEPEEENFRALEKIARRSFGRVLVTRQCLLANVDATLHLELNPDNPADHRIGTRGVPTPSARLDTVVGSLGWPCIGLLKIDVQGAEGLVLEGAKETLARSRPAMYIEIDDGALRRFGSSAQDLERQLSGLGYAMYQADPRRLTVPIDSARAALIRSRVGYADFVFLPRS